MAAPAPTPAPAPQIKVIVYKKELISEYDIKKLIKQKEVKGIIINQVDKLDNKVQSLLRQSLPSVNIDQCYILEDGREPASGFKIMGFFALGGLLIFGGGLGIKNNFSDK